MPVKVVVACGSGVATSQTVASKVNRMLKADKINAEVEAVDLKSVDRPSEGCCGLHHHRQGQEGVSPPCH